MHRVLLNVPGVARQTGCSWSLEPFITTRHIASSKHKGVFQNYNEHDIDCKLFMKVD